jgi:hypothetical protein
MIDNSLNTLKPSLQPHAVLNTIVRVGAEYCNSLLVDRVSSQRFCGLSMGGKHFRLRLAPNTKTAKAVNHQGDDWQRCSQLLLNLTQADWQIP